MRTRFQKRHIALLGLFAVLSVAGIFYLRSDQRGEVSAIIRPFEQAKDFQPLVKLMNDNKYWISENPNFSPEKMLLTRAPQLDPTKKGLAQVDVIEDEDTTAGFIAYYKKSGQEGFIWILAIDKDFRGRGFGEMLVKHALSSLKKQNVNYVTMATRTINKPALALYKKMGFIEDSREEDRGMVFLIKRNL